MTDTLQVRIHSITEEARGIHSFDLRPAAGAELPPFTAGAHIDIHLGNRLVRSYSLINPQGERHRYVIAVSKDPKTRGGSRYVHENLRVADTLAISAPRNNFALREDAVRTVFLAGGIGITPIWCMIQRLEALGRTWELHYCVRTREQAAFLEPLRALPGERVKFNFDHEPGGKLLDVAAVVAAIPAEAHLYCCGPAPMLAAFEAACARLPKEQVHVEYFTAKPEEPGAGGLEQFTVVLKRSGREFVIPPGKTILETLLDAGLDVPYSCTQGVCGTCETPVLEGVPDHRDMLLTEEERAAGKTILICCSRSKTERLVLDL